MRKEVLQKTCEECWDLVKELYDDATSEDFKKQLPFPIFKALYNKNQNWILNEKISNDAKDRMIRYFTTRWCVLVNYPYEIEDVVSQMEKLGLI